MASRLRQESDRNGRMKPVRESLVKPALPERGTLALQARLGSGLTATSRRLREGDQSLRGMAMGV